MISTLIAGLCISLLPMFVEKSVESILGTVGISLTLVVLAMCFFSISVLSVESFNALQLLVKNPVGLERYLGVTKKIREGAVLSFKLSTLFFFVILSLYFALVSSPVGTMFVYVNSLLSVFACLLLVRNGLYQRKYYRKFRQPFSKNKQSS
eukprot:TRINITY_DN3986_c0_g1_i1.p1 TRINITY_DN3986_c0_g1~~TRINITY_DN3986_c0_g1_i1.p1  ORF type:complete len:151 (-),score=16.20 TRINITY_DN3986_c0_g1_i1:15-467(-)